ncbi:MULTISPECIES: fumarylacetoacetate hydrolase family protein [Sphingobium]|nr:MULTISPECIES: fumarylacetoacetate hydrolase family protein [Sphingobium]WDA39236.1 fumarylacetoacetate hydrolase family protein [Sphingobium sp. YC-XJ3]
MKLCSFENKGSPTYGVARADGKVVDLKPVFGPRGVARLEDLIIAMTAGEIAQSEILEAAAKADGIDEGVIEWLPPLPRPSKILAVAANNRIVQRMAVRPSSNPSFFLKPPSSLTGHKRPIIMRKDYGVTHPEPEMAIIIGKGGSRISEEDARSHIFGYSILDDITSPSLKERDSMELVLSEKAIGGYKDLMGWRNVTAGVNERSIYLTYHTISKGADTFGPMGPWIVTAEEISNPNNLAIRCYDADELIFEDSTANLIFPVEKIVSHASHYMKLEPGDVISCGSAMKPPPNGRVKSVTDWNLQKTKGPIAIEIDQIGRLVSTVEIIE